MTRSSKHWPKPPGSMDTLHLHRHQWPAEHPLGFPDLLPQSLVLQDLYNLSMMPYHTPERDPATLKRGICHFFLDDYRFESTWTRPETGLQRVQRFRMTLTPDFSLYANWPTVAQQWNHYRSQWLGRYWQEHGVIVIPTVNWSTPDSYYWSFAGIPTGQILAIAVPDVRDPNTHRLFYGGFRAMIQQLRPSAVLSYGRVPPKLRRYAGDTPIREYPTHWQQKRRASDV